MPHIEHARRVTGPRVSRRALLAGATSAAALSAAPAPAEAADSPARPRYCLNTSTIRGQELTLRQQAEVAAQAGYDGMEPWIGDLQKWRQSGQPLTDLGKRIRDLGLTVESAIGFAPWIVDDGERRAAGLQSARSDMQLVKQLGGSRIAAPPVGATRQGGLDLFAAAERYARLLQVGREEGVTPQLELWGFSQNLSRLGELMLVAVESGDADACLLPDVYHIYKGGSDFAGLKLINGERIFVFHVNDYPADPPRETIGDADRVYPGEGVAPLSQILSDLWASGFRGALSLELFNRDYWRQDALQVARRGLESMQQAVRRAKLG